MAIVVVIAGVILTALLPALIDIRRSAQFTATQTNLQSLLRATAAYTLANGCLPCPTPANNMSSSTLGKVGTTNGAACGQCNSADGIAPFVAMGIDPTTAKDGWGRWITMHIDPTLASPIACSNADIVANVTGCSKGDATVSGLCRANLSPSGSPIIVNFRVPTTAKAAVIFVSHGANGYGAYRTQQTTDTAKWRYDIPTPCKPLLGQTEACNSKSADNRNDQSFWYDERGNNFDDVLTYADRNALVSLFGTAACTTPW